MLLGMLVNIVDWRYDNADFFEMYLLIAVFLLYEIYGNLK